MEPTDAAHRSTTQGRVRAWRNTAESRSAREKTNGRSNDKNFVGEYRSGTVA